MACPYLEYCSRGFFSLSSDCYICKVTGVEMPHDAAKVKHLCDADDRYAYEDCPVYRDNR